MESHKFVEIKAPEVASELEESKQNEVEKTVVGIMQSL